MKITGQHTLDAPRDVVWKALLDPAVLVNTLPGCDELERTGENEFRGKITLKVGPVKGLFEGKVRLSDLDPPAGYRMSIEGRGTPGFVNGQGRIELHEEDGTTRLGYEIDAQVGGRIAGVGQRLLDSSAKVLTRQAIEGLDEQIRLRLKPAGPSQPESPTGSPETEEGGGGAAGAVPRDGGPSQARFVARFLGGVLGELVPQKRRPVVAAVAVGVFLVALTLVLRACNG